MQQISPAALGYITNNRLAQNQTNNAPLVSQAANVASELDTAKIAGKKPIDKKKAAIIIGAAAATVALGVLIFAKRKDIGKFINNTKDKIKGIFSGKQKYEISIPKNGKYDMSKEADVIGIASYDCHNGYSCGIVFDKNGQCAKDAISDTQRKFILELQSHGCFNDYGIYDGKAYVRYNIDQNKGFMKGISSLPDYGRGQKYFVDFTLLSPNERFTPAQQNLITLIEQGKSASPHALDFKKFDPNTPMEKFYDAIGKWSQDIDVSPEAGELNNGILEIMGKLKNGFSRLCGIEELKISKIELH